MARDAVVRFHTASPGEPLLRLDDVVVEYPGTGSARRSSMRAVDGVTLDVVAGRSVGLVGESGCGKTSLGRAIVGLAPISGGSVSIAERPHPGSGPSRSRTGLRLARSVQMVFQDPYSSLDPRQRVGNAVAEPMVIHGIGTDAERHDRVARLLERVGLGPSLASAYPHQLSGGQRQRVCIARALAVAPLLMVCDEPTSALDVSIQAQVVELFRELQVDEGLTYLFVTHDLALLPQLVDDLAVMYLGRIVESGPAEALLRSPQHPYTVSLLEAVPVLGRRRTATTRRSLRGEALTDDDSTVGCPFRPRCWLYRELAAADSETCRTETPVPRVRVAAGAESQRAPGHLAACHHVTPESVTVRNTRDQQQTSPRGADLTTNPGFRDRGAGSAQGSNHT